MAQPGSETGEISPLYDPLGPFLIYWTVKHCNLRATFYEVHILLCLETWSARSERAGPLEQALEIGLSQDGRGSD